MTESTAVATYGIPTRTHITILLGYTKEKKRNAPKFASRVFVQIGPNFHSLDAHLLLECLFLLLQQWWVGVKGRLGIGSELHLGHLRKWE